MQHMIQDIGTHHSRSHHGVKSDGLLDIIALRATDRILSFQSTPNLDTLYDTAAAHDLVDFGS